MKTDRQLQHEVVAELEWDRWVPAEICVAVSGGVATLTGKVGSKTEKFNAERAARRVLGDKALVDEIEVRPPAPSQRTNADISRAAENVLQSSSAVPADAVHVAVDSGWVTLSGHVDWQYERRAAKDIVRRLRGVAGVTDQIEVGLPVTTSAVKVEIQAALTRRATADATAIEAEVRCAEVTLTGTVRSTAERELAIHSAWNLPGVHAVVDKLTLEQ